MPNTLLSLHADTPRVAGAFRTLSFLRTPQAPEAPARRLVSRAQQHPFSRTTRLFGARALDHEATGHADAVTVAGLTGQPLSLHTADGDATLTLTDAAGRSLWSRNAQGTVSVLHYDAAPAGGRPRSLTEIAAGASAGRVREQYAYVPLHETPWKNLNLAGGLSEHRDNAGIHRPLSASVMGQPLAAEQCLLKPEVDLPDWGRHTEADTEAPLRVSGRYDATGAPLSTTNAAGVTTLTDYAINGAVVQTRLAYTEAGIPQEIVTLQAIRYRADGVVLSQRAGNGVIDTYEYDPRTQYLTRHLTARPAGHPEGALLISDLHYRYDAVGNILSLDDQGADPQWHANQQATGLREYAYDTLYRLTHATGRERSPVSRYYPGETSAGSVWRPYRETYQYDNGGNLTAIHHVGGAGDRTRALDVAAGSNRALAAEHPLTPDTGFWAGGLQKQLTNGRPLHWYADNQLRQVSAVSRDEAADDTERYQYADGGTRTRKINTTTVNGSLQITLTTYAGDCEIRQRRLAGQTAPQKHLVITQAGEVRLVEDRLSGQAHLRYSFSDHLGSVGGETDVTGRIVSREEYAPYGGTTGSDEAATEVSNLTQRTLRYSGKELDATGLYYYGWRYYQPELGRWLSADPGGLVDGTNLFRMVRNCPLMFHDNTGRYPKSAHYIWLGKKEIAANAMSNIIHFKFNNSDYKVNLWSDAPEKLKNNLIERGYSKELFKKINIQAPIGLSTELSSAVARESSNTPFANYAAASDLLRLGVLEKFGGGIYMDVDVMVAGRLGEIKSQRMSSAGPSDVLIHQELWEGRARISNAVIVAKEKANSLKRMINYATAPYRGKLYDMGVGRFAGKDGLSVKFQQAPYHSVSVDDVMWILKRTIPKVRHELTILATGPGMIDSWVQASGLSPRLLPSKFIGAPEQFGQRANHPLGSWVKGMNGEGSWVFSSRKRRASLG
ncbi:RHS repeat-associated core domain-containing protein [Pseudomonas sp. Q1]|uniref:RHS repeat-associated core domain-containing protein n=1 Tax=Pseudomonas sp. Q1 TaxID=2202823 RepID=UPI001374B81D|nr:RHS repeat-associated core domain-containing protein [Pseudomonas sp. Q1]